MARPPTMHNLAGRMRDIGEAVERDINQLVTDVVANVAGELARRTPVDTAMARSNWHTSLGAPASGTLFPYKAYKSRWRQDRRGKLGKGGRFGETINTKSVMEQARVALLPRTPDALVFITNNVEYIGALMDGHSQQAPAGYIYAGISAGITKGIRSFRWHYVRRA